MRGRRLLWISCHPCALFFRTDFGDKARSEGSAVVFLVEDVAFGVGVHSEESRVDFVRAQVTVSQGPNFFNPGVVLGFTDFAVNDTATECDRAQSREIERRERIGWPRATAGLLFKWVRPGTINVRRGMGANQEHLQ